MDTDNSRLEQDFEQLEEASPDDAVFSPDKSKRKNETINTTDGLNLKSMAIVSIGTLLLLGVLSPEFQSSTGRALDSLSRLNSIPKTTIETIKNGHDYTNFGRLKFISQEVSLSGYGAPWGVDDQTETVNYQTQTWPMIIEGHELLLELQSDGMVDSIPEVLETEEDVKKVAETLSTINLQVMEKDYNHLENMYHHYANEAFAEVFSLIHIFLAAGLGILSNMWRPKRRAEENSNSTRVYIDVETGEQISEQEWLKREEVAKQKLQVQYGEDLPKIETRFGSSVNYQQMLATLSE